MSESSDSAAVVVSTDLPANARTASARTSSDPLEASTAATVHARITDAMTSLSDASRIQSPGIASSGLAMAAATSVPMLDRDRRDRLERFADHQLGMLSEVCRLVDEGNPPTAIQLHEQWTRAFLLAKTSDCTGDWEAAAYPLVVTIDECLLELSWPGQRWWEDHVLEATLFGTRVGSQRFFEMAGKLTAQRSQSIGATLLRIHHECVAIGFRGLYATPSPASLAQPLGLPAHLSQWRAELRRSMLHREAEMDSAVYPSPSDRRAIPGAPPLRFYAATWVLGVSGLIALAVNLLLWSGTWR